MDRSKLKYLVDAGMLISFLLVFFTGMIKFPLLLKYLPFRRSDLPVAELNFIHDWCGLFLGILVAIHLLLNRKWIVAMTRKIFNI